jgi:hypothetical protein
VTQPNPLANLDPQQLAAILAAVQGQQAPAAPVNPAVGMPVQPAAPVAPVAPSVDVDIADVMGGASYGPKLFDADDPIGTAFTGTLARAVVAKQDRDFDTKQPKFYNDGNPVPVVIIDLDVPVTERHPEGRATHYARGKDIAAFNRAAADAGVPREVIKTGLEPGATITITFAELRKNPKFPHSNPAKIRVFQYTRPGSTPPAAPAVQAAPAPAVAQPAAPAAPVVPAVGNNPAGVDAAAILAALGAATPPAA